MTKPIPTCPAERHHDRRLLLYLALTALVCGAAVMIIEVLGSRVLGPFFGASLYVWTSLITITLVALAVGYWCGGLISDRTTYSCDLLYGIIAAAGGAVLLVPVLKGTVITLSLPLGLRIGSLVAAGLLFAPSLVLLGMVSPCVIRIGARETASIGRTVGLFSSISTVGSFLGTVCTGFVLIAFFPINRIFMVVGGVLLGVSIVYVLVFRRSWLLLPLLGLPLLVPPDGGAKTKLFPDGKKLTRIFYKDTFYGNMQVHEYTMGNQRTRNLVVDATVQGGIDLVSGQSLNAYPYFLQFIPRIINPHGRECLVVGLGPGVIPMWYERQGVRTDVVDIDPDVFDVAKRYFGFAVSGGSYAEDARYFLNRGAKKYDYVILDVFNGDSTPSHALSREALEAVKRRLADGGVLGINMFGAVRGDTLMTASVVRTLKEVFRTVAVYPVLKEFDPIGIGNIELFAYDGPGVEVRAEELTAWPVHPQVEYARPLMLKPFSFPKGTPAMVLTDSYNPIDFYDARLKEFSRRRILEYSDIDFLLG